MPVIVKLTPNITDIRKPAEAAKAGGADAVSLINTINSITAVDLDNVRAGADHRRQGRAWRLLRTGGQADCAFHGVRNRPHPETHGLPISGIGGVTTWRDAAEFIALGCGTVQVCTAAMTYGFKVVQEMIAGLENYMDEKGYATIEDFRGRRFRTSPTGSI
jgi:dihydropyrimidine dehydrogenase (NAD+) subunit PreA